MSISQLSEVNSKNFSDFVGKYRKADAAKQSTFNQLFDNLDHDSPNLALSMAAPRIGQFDPNNPLGSFSFDPNESMFDFTNAAGQAAGVRDKARIGLISSAFEGNNAANAVDIAGELGMRKANHETNLASIKSQGRTNQIMAGLSGIGQGLALKSAWNSLGT